MQIPRTFLRRKSHDSRSFAHEQEVDRGGVDEHVNRSVRRDVRGLVLDEEFTRSRDVDMTRRLVRSGISRKVNHVDTGIGWRNNIRSAVLVWNVRVEERSRHFAEEINTVRLNADGGDVSSFRLNNVTGTSTVERGGSGRCRGDNTKTMPIFHVSINDRYLRSTRGGVRVGGGVSNWLESNVDGFGRPLERGELLLIRRLG